MNIISQETLENALKPFDIVRTKSGEIAFIREVNLNSCQSSPKYQVSYAVSFITENKSGDKSAWYDNDELELIGNMFVKIAQAAAGHQQSYNVEKLFNNIKPNRGTSWDTKKVKDTKIARKMNEGKIIKELNGELEIKK